MGNRAHIDLGNEAFYNPIIEKGIFEKSEFSFGRRYFLKKGIKIYLEDVPYFCGMRFEGDFEMLCYRRSKHEIAFIMVLTKGKIIEKVNGRVWEGEFSHFDWKRKGDFPIRFVFCGKLYNIKEGRSGKCVEEGTWKGSYKDGNIVLGNPVRNLLLKMISN